MIIKKVVCFLLLLIFWFYIKAAGYVTLLEWINQSFLVGIAALMAGACMVIFKSGFLTLFFQGFRTIGSFITPKSNAMERAEALLNEDELIIDFKKSFASKAAFFAFLLGASSITVSIIGLIFYN
ncbi:DUF3899 domain-containing protein [Neobacillus terrae]|uniref:DUF3899 domain-containing protein n=1 Tax=Neobacillus terrae TaxID=3034837 RepID=UPI00140AD53C|nr:DUF3899 domain-containing protein [Neobacillus terrae]NHM31716.1 DUF3899 domain-containing protein [Neobacillus terrae]